MYPGELYLESPLQGCFFTNVCKRVDSSLRHKSPTMRTSSAHSTNSELFSFLYTKLCTHWGGRLVQIVNWRNKQIGLCRGYIKTKIMHVRNSFYGSVIQYKGKK